MEEKSSLSINVDDDLPLFFSQELEEELGFIILWEIRVFLGRGFGSYTSEGFMLPHPQPALAVNIDLRRLFLLFVDIGGRKLKERKEN